MKREKRYLLPARLLAKYVLYVLVTGFVYNYGNAQELITTSPASNSFPLVTASGAAGLLIDPTDDALVGKTAVMLQQDVASVTGKKPALLAELPTGNKNIVIIGTVNKCSFLQTLINNKKIDVSGLTGKWEAFQIQVVNAPMKGIDRALVIAGSDRRGAAYGVMTLLQQMGVSPWYWWADVPVQRKNTLYVKPGAFTDMPKVKYRGIFLNDEAPALSNWSKQTFGGFNHTFYARVFELLLRLKSNYIWPAMWGNAFYDDDSLNRQTAEQYGIVIGTSHHEPLMRAHDEWRRYGKGGWNFDSNEMQLKDFWRAGMERATNEKMVTIGMRGDGDKPMSNGTATALLEKIVDSQRHIIETVTRQPASATPQIWALYKEVQDYYDEGMRVPDDVTLLLCDDNWGNIRRLPALTDPPRAGGYGIYYHFDYVGGPRNYKWINTNNLARVWEQMHLAWEYNVKQVWIANVGDLKPMELPISFFLDYAWNPGKWNEDNIQKYYSAWAARQFGAAHANAIGDLLRLYAQYSARRKPEMIDAQTYSLQHYNTAATVLNEWRSLQAKAETINTQLSASYRDAYFELVLFPIKAMCNLHELYYSVAQNQYYSEQHKTIANKYADKASQFFLNDSLLAVQYHTIAGGKWNHMMRQTHIGYRWWQEPPRNSMPKVTYVPGGAASEAGDSLAGNAVALKPRTALSLIPASAKGKLFYENNGYISMEAEHYTRVVNKNGIVLKVIPGIGKTGGGLTAFPVTAPEQQPTPEGTHAEYHFYMYDTGTVQLQAFFSPTLNFQHRQGLQYMVAIDYEQPQIVTLNKEDGNVHTWETWVADNIIIKTTRHSITKPGSHVLKYYVISPGVVLQKLVIDSGGLQDSYLGPPETIINR